jgi:CyaY protein
MALSESDFEHLADRTLNDLVEVLADSEEEGLEAELESGVLSIVFTDRTKYVVNSHRAARQIWMAADASAWHFDWNGESWLSSKTGEELWTLVRERISKKLGKPLDLEPPAR